MQPVPEDPASSDGAVDTPTAAGHHPTAPPRRWWQRRAHWTPRDPGLDQVVAVPDPVEMYPSLQVVEDELDRAELASQQRAQSLDGKAGLILGAAGVIVALAAAHESVLRTVGQGFAVAAGAAAGWAFLPRTGGTINPAGLQEHYLDQPELQTRLTLLATRTDLYQADEESLKRKFRRLRWAVGLLLLAAVAVFAGSILDVS